MHPVIVTTALQDDTRQGALALDGPLRGSGYIVPYCGIGGSLTSLSCPLVSYLAGTDEKDRAKLTALVPTAVATLFGLYSRIGLFIPEKAAYEKSGEQYFSNSKAVIVPNTLSGPGITPSASNMMWGTKTESKYSVREMKTVSHPTQAMYMWHVLTRVFVCRWSTCLTYSMLP
jgi:hypothetical protein